MTTRLAVAKLAESFVGYVPEPGQYDGRNQFSEALGRPAQEAWCGDFVTDIYVRAGLPLPCMQAGMPGRQTGFSYVPAGWDYARAHGATAYSYQSQPGDFVIFGFGSDFPQHVEMAIDWADGVLRTGGGNSNGATPHEDGGVWLHEWSAPAGVGNANIIGIIDAGKLVKFTAAAKPKVED